VLILLVGLVLNMGKGAMAQDAVSLRDEVLKLFPPGTDPDWAFRVWEKEQSAYNWRDTPPLPAGPGKTSNQPEQDCPFAIPVCQQTYVQANSYTGRGNIQEVPTTSCLGVRERNSVWYVFTVQSNGTLEFQINSPADYDWALYDLTGRSCPDILTGSAPEVRCNFSATTGSTGISAQGANNSEPAGGSNQSRILNVTAGQTFALVIDNYSQNQTGYTLTFGGSASIFDNTPPTPSQVQAPCNENVLTLIMSEPVLCNSIAPNGSDFELTGPGGPFTILAANGQNCGNFDAQIELAFSPPLLTDSTYTLIIRQGSDNNTLIDNCGNPAVAGIQITFQPSLTVTIQGSSTVCAGNPVTLTANPGQIFLWNTGATSRSISVTPSNTTTYSVDVISGDCQGSAQFTVTPRQGHVAGFTASTVCVGQPTTFYNTSLLVEECPVPFLPTFCIPNPAIFNLTFGTGNPQDVFFAAQIFPTLPGVPPLFQFDSTQFTYTQPGTYEAVLTVADSTAGCVSVYRQQVTVLDTNSRPKISGDTIVCNGAPATLTASGSSRFQWPDGSTAASFTFTPTADTLVTLIGFNDCAVPPQQFTVTQLVRVVAAPSVNAGLDTLDVCEGVPVNLNGSVQNAGGGVWIGGNGTFVPNRDTLAVSYLPTATEAALGGVSLRLQSTGNGPGCPTAEDRIFLRIGTSLPIPQVNCGAGGNGNVIFEWNAVGGADSYEVSTDGGATFGPPSAGPTGLSHTVGGVASTDSVTIILRAVGSGNCGTSPNSPPTTCYPCAAPLAPVLRCGAGSGDTVRFEWNAVGTATRYEVSSNGGLTFVAPSSGAAGLSHVITGVAPGGSVTVRVRAVGCGAGPLSAALTCTTGDCPALSVSLGSDRTVCEGDSLSIVATVTGDAENLSFIWSDVSLPATAGPHRIAVTQSLTLRVEVADLDNPDCPTAQASVALTAALRPDITVTVSPPLPADLRTENAELTFTASNSGDTVPLQWAFGDGSIAQDSALVSTLTRSYRYRQEGTYEPYVVVTTAAGCSDTLRLGTLTVLDRETIYLPNVFTPNGDGVNDDFRVLYQGFSRYRLVIFDRWGGVVFNNGGNPQLFWNGQKNNSGNACPEGVYLFRLDAERRDGRTYEQAGSITLVR
jgi:gliding motility-associated-like protein